MGSFLYGIDFGTSNSALSIYDEEKKEIVTTISIPSLLYFPADHLPGESVRYFVGKEAITEYIKEGMTGRFMKSIKRVLPRHNFVDTKIHSERYTASDLVALILRELKAQADAIVGHDVQKAVMGRPVFFDDDNAAFDALAQKRLLKATQDAGFSEVCFQYEPIGAAFAYERSIKQKEKVLVADLGGGTTDFTFVELDPSQIGQKDRRSAIKASGGIYIGGDSFDSAFMWEKGTPYFGRGVQYESMPGKFLEVPLVYFSNICSWEKMNFFHGQKVVLELQKYYSYTHENEKLKNLLTLTEHNLGYSVFQSIEKTKIELSNSEKAAFSYSNLEIEIQEDVALNCYNSIIQKEIEKIERYLDTFLTKNQISAQEIDSLFLTGGTSLVVAVQEMFRKKLPNAAIRSEDNFISVAKGLAYSGYLFDGL